MLAIQIANNGNIFMDGFAAPVGTVKPIPFGFHLHWNPDADIAEADKEWYLRSIISPAFRRGDLF